MNFVLFTLLLPLLFVAARDELLVKVKNGILRGRYMETKGGRTILGFTGIPYAKPPLGELRFEPPQPAEDWTGILDATKVHEMCPQINRYIKSVQVVGSEDCLYLNVYTPKKSERKEPLPVMMFIHGGGWFSCSGNTDFYGPDVLLEKDVVLVSINYRLGALGLLSTGDEVVPGNNLFKDQVLALKWIKENIEEFGGNPNRVTVFGNSAGGSSAHLLMLSPLAKGLFHAAISESGVATCSWAIDTDNQGPQEAKKLGELCNCPTKTSKDMIDCLKKVDVEDIVAKDDAFMLWDLNPTIIYQPVVEPKHDGAFLDQHPVDVVERGQALDVPWIVGVNTGDGAVKAAAIAGNPKLLEEFNDNVDWKISLTTMLEHYSKDSVKLASKLRQFYFGDKRVDNNTVQNLTNLYTDVYFLSCADQMVRLHKKKSQSPIYYYLFGYRGTSSFSSVFGDPARDYGRIVPPNFIIESRDSTNIQYSAKQPNLTGASHADELQYLFPVGDMLFKEASFTKEDKKMASLMTRMWSNFAKYGDPTPATDNNFSERWTPVKSTDSLEYLSIGRTGALRMDKGLLQERAEFWRTILEDEEQVQVIRDEL